MPSERISEASAAKGQNLTAFDARVERGLMLWPELRTEIAAAKTLAEWVDLRCLAAVWADYTQ